MQLPEAAVFVKKLGHGGAGLGWGALLPG
jgi:hypothetical protein